MVHKSATIFIINVKNVQIYMGQFTTASGLTHLKQRKQSGEFAPLYIPVSPMYRQHDSKLCRPTDETGIQGDRLCVGNSCEIE